jgi:hypothetical protein
MTSIDIEQQLNALRSQLQSAQSAKAGAVDRKSFDQAADVLMALQRDIEFAELSFAKLRAAEEKALRETQLANLSKLIAATKVAKQTEVFNPLVARVASAYDALLAELATLNQAIQAKGVEVAAAVSEASLLASALDVAPLKPTSPVVQASALLARALLGKPKLGHSIQVFENEEVLLDYVAGLFDMSPFVHSFVRYKDDPTEGLYPVSKQIEDLLTGTFESRKSEISHERQRRSENGMKYVQATERASRERLIKNKEPANTEAPEDDPLEAPLVAASVPLGNPLPVH